jgi:hypothetical protein
MEANKSYDVTEHGYNGFSEDQKQRALEESRLNDSKIREFILGTILFDPSIYPHLKALLVVYDNASGDFTHKLREVENEAQNHLMIHFDIASLLYRIKILDPQVALTFSIGNLLGNHEIDAFINARQIDYQNYLFIWHFLFHIHDKLERVPISKHEEYFASLRAFWEALYE